MITKQSTFLDAPDLVTTSAESWFGTGPTPEQRTHEYFATPPALVTASIGVLPECFVPGTILDAGAGETGIWGLAAKQRFPNTTLHGIDIRAIPPVTGFDGWAHGSFLEYTDHSYDLVVSNPPFSLAEAFLLHTMQILRAGGYALFLLRQAFLASIGRYERLYTQGYHPARVATAVPRPSFTGNGVSDQKTEYAVFLWQKGHEGSTVMEWMRWQ